MEKIISLLVAVVTILTFNQVAFATENITSFIYFTGIGCPHCANTDPIILKQEIRETDMLVIEYEIYRDSINAPLLLEYNSKFGTGLAVPTIVAGTKKNDSISGDDPILKNLSMMVEAYAGNMIPLLKGPVSLDKLSLTSLPAKPKIWFRDRIAIRTDTGSQEDKIIKQFLLEGIQPEGCKSVADNTVALSDYTVKFNNACSFNGWTLMND